MIYEQALKTKYTSRPIYISNCPTCESDLIYLGEISDSTLKSNPKLPNPSNWVEKDIKDEWVCPECLDKVYFDWKFLHE